MLRSKRDWTTSVLSRKRTLGAAKCHITIACITGSRKQSDEEAALSAAGDAERSTKENEESMAKNTCG